MSSIDRLRATEAELVRCVRNLAQVQYLPHLEAALREYDEARATRPNRRLRRLASRSKKTEAQMRADLRRPYP